MTNTEVLVEKIRSLSPQKIDEVLQFVDNLKKIEELSHPKKSADTDSKSISRFFGCISADVFGDPVAYQRSLRDEWD
jgi:hypothetical protein